MDLWLAMQDLNQPFYIAGILGLGLIMSIAHTAGRKERARRRHPASRGRS